jgi:hypothetical protein
MSLYQKKAKNDFTVCKGIPRVSRGYLPWSVEGGYTLKLKGIPYPRGIPTHEGTSGNARKRKNYKIHTFKHPAGDVLKCPKM